MFILIENLVPSKKRAPAQDALKKEKNILNEEIVSLYKRKHSGLCDEATIQNLTIKKRRLDEIEARIRLKESDAKRQQKQRALRKKTMMKAMEKYPELRNDLKVMTTYKSIYLSSFKLIKIIKFSI